MKKGYFSEKVVDWYADHLRNLPWRFTRDPYRIWLSEIILQQTRVAQGLPYYKKFVKYYPNVRALATASERQVLRLWQGLGYYSRARNLHACARQVVRDFDSRFPATFDALKKLPGIGDYTAAAIASIAFDQSVAVIDGNVFRVLARVFGIDSDIGSSEGKKVFRDLANSLVPAGNAGQYNQAVMEFGALQCLPLNPKCDACIFSKGCVANRDQSQHLLPMKVRKAKPSRRYFNYFVIRNRGKILMNEREGNDIWRGLFDFPVHEESKALSQAMLMGKMNSAVVDRISDVYKHVLTHQVIFARFLEMDVTHKRFPEFEKAKWYTPRQVAALPKPGLIVRFFRDRGIDQESAGFGNFTSTSTKKQGRTKSINH